jgi:cellulose synthase/poly-beta-1,6-N-acetylglucosamine synthase-like glycosyltransferase
LFSDDVRGVSVIVAARNEAGNLRDYLHSLLEQDYPMYEVIVVDDRSEDNTRQVLDDMMLHYPRLRRTFVPQHARIISSKKLALTLGIKGARYDYLLLTDADCRPASRQWISSVMRGFDTATTEVVLGYGAYFYEKSALNRLIRYETLTTGLQYMGLAAAGHPYMGVGRNLAYKKSLFVRSNGFTGLTGEQAGDDDLFVNRVAKRKNTNVVYGGDTLTWSVPETTWEGWWQQRRRHLSVAHLYRTGSRMLIGFEPLTRCVWYAAVIAMLAVASPLLKMAALAAFLLRWVVQWIVLNVSAKRLGVHGIGAELIIWDWLYPLLTLLMLSLPRHKNRLW